jgi:hypothetical protein
MSFLPLHSQQFKVYLTPRSKLYSSLNAPVFLAITALFDITKVRWKNV